MRHDFYGYSSAVCQGERSGCKSHENASGKCGQRAGEGVFGFDSGWWEFVWGAGCDQRRDGKRVCDYFWRVGLSDSRACWAKQGTSGLYWISAHDV